MSSILGLTSEEAQRVRDRISPLQSVASFCAELAAAAREVPLREALLSVAPWAAKGGRIIGEAALFAKILVSLADDILKEKDPEVLGLLACTLSYQHSAVTSLHIQGEPRARAHVALEDSLARAQAR